MEIPELKTRLDIISVANHLGIETDKHGRALCPFHNDKKPSLQFSKEKQICTCFSSNCNIDTMDVISLTENKLNVNTHEALKYLQQHLNVVSPQRRDIMHSVSTASKPNYQNDFEQMQSSLIASSIARNYLESRNLNRDLLQVGYNAFKNSKFNYLRGCITFGLKDKNDKVVSMYGRSVKEPRASAGNNKEEYRHFYTTNRKGLYPKYPPAETTKLILTESIIDAATLLQNPLISTHYTILAAYGTNGITPEHSEAIKNLKQLEEIIFWFDGDEAGKKGAEKAAKELSIINDELLISIVETPEGEDINSLLKGHEPEVFTHLLENRKVESLDTQIIEELPKETNNMPAEALRINIDNPNNIIFITTTANYFIKGGIRKDLDSMKVTLVIESGTQASNYRNKLRCKLDLFDYKQTERIAKESAEKLNLRTDLIEHDLNILTDLLDEYRESIAPANNNEEEQKVTITNTEKEKCYSFLKTPNLLPRINDLIGKSGVVGEENNRLFLFGIASSYKMQDTLHALIQGSSGSGKTHLLATIMDFMPPEDTISLTRVTESSFYNYGQYELQNKLIGMEDYDGLEEKAELAFRELQSKGMISSSTSGKNEQTGEITGYVKKVYGPIASLSATTRGELYEDNMSRCFLVAVDEGMSQTRRIIKYQNQRAAGIIDTDKEIEIRDFLRNCMRLLQPHKVVNPYADKIELPKEAHKIRRLNDLFQCYVKQITLLNQYQRQRTAAGALITEKEDVKMAIEIMFDSIVLKVDELDGSLRNFYEKLKEYVLKKGKEYEFTRLEIRQALKLSKTQQHSYMSQLLDLEYIAQVGGYANRGFKYKIQYWDNNKKLRDNIREYLNKQLNNL